MVREWIPRAVGTAQIDGKELKPNQFAFLLNWYCAEVLLQMVIYLIHCADEVR